MNERNTTKEKMKRNKEFPYRSMTLAERKKWLKDTETIERFRK